MTSTRFSSGLVSLYPRESDELQMLLEKHQVAYGSPDAIYSFPEALRANPALQQGVREFVARSRSNPRGPVSRGAMLHLMLSAIGGPGAVDLGPEADGASNHITTFLEQLGGWPEDAFADIEDPGSTDGFASPSFDYRQRSNGGAPNPQRNGHHHDSAATAKLPPAELPSAALQEIVLALTRLEASHRDTSAMLDQIDTRLRKMEEHRDTPSPYDLNNGLALSEPTSIGVPVPHVASLSGSAPSPAPDTGLDPFPASQRSALSPSQMWAESPPRPVIPEPAARAQEDAPPVFPATIQPEPEVPLAVISPAQDLPLPLVSAAPIESVPAASGPALIASTGVLAEEPATPAVLTTASPAPIETRITPPAPTREWKEIFAPPEKPERRVAVVPLLIACLIVAAIIVAGVIFFLRNEGASSQPESGNTPSAAPSLTQPSPDSSDAAAAAPRTTRLSPTPPARNETAQTARPETPPSGTGSKDRVLGARETFQPHSTTEAFPAPKQPSFVAASTMESRLVYAPPPQHPRIAGLVGLSGMVVMEVVVDSDGTVETVHVLGGHHLLRDAAVNAVRTWRYRPVLQNGRPVPIRTIVRVDFSKGDTDTANN